MRENDEDVTLVIVIIVVKYGHSNCQANGYKIENNEYSVLGFEITLIFYNFTL